MQSQEITTILNEYFGIEAVQNPTADSWQIDTMQIRLLVILSEDKSWLRLLMPIAPLQQAEPYLEQLLEANFDLTQEVRYALYQDVLWGVFQHSYPSLTAEDFEGAIAQMISIKQKGFDECFSLMVEKRIRQIVTAAKQQGQSLESTLQNLNRMYEEGILGGLQQDPQEREQFLAAWQYQLERLWEEEEE